MDDQTVKVEGIITAYFAKEEFTKETAEVAGQHKYIFANDNNNIDKDKIAGIIKKKVDAIIKADKKYSKIDDIKAALTATSYKKTESISFNLYKLGANFIKINSAPLEEEVYVVANTYLLNGKEVTIKIKEKEAILVGADADLNVLEAKENGAEITTLKATVEDGIAKVKIKLRPKSDEDLKTWKEKLAGIKDGTHTYKFGGDGNNTRTAEQKKKIAGIIAGKIKATLDGLKKFAKPDVIEKALTKEVYNKNEEITFDVYKTVIENLWLKAECQGDTKKHEGEFLKKEGQYFVIGKGKLIIFPLLVKPLNDIQGIHKKFYWAEEKKGNNRVNQAAYNSNRSGGARKHAARDLYTEPYTQVVAIAKGVVLGISNSFADGTGAVTVLHEIEDGRKFIIRYGEVENNTISVKVGQEINQKAEIGKTGFLRSWHKRVVSGYDIYMLHFEYFTGDLGYNIEKNPLSTGDTPFLRRKDLADPFDILKEGYENTFDKISKQNSRWANSEFANLIANKESGNNYNACNKTKGGYKIINNLSIVNLTIQEVQAKQEKRDVFAVGRFQLIPITLNGAVSSLGLNTDEKLDEEMQDRIFEEYLIDKKRPNIIAYLEGNGSIEDAMYDSAKEWACIGVEKGKRISDKLVKDKDGKITERIVRYASGGETYYADDGLNKAHITPEEIKATLIKSKNENQ